MGFSLGLHQSKVRHEDINAYHLILFQEKPIVPILPNQLTEFMI
jgi:hypothetical protein